VGAENGGGGGGGGGGGRNMFLRKVDNFAGVPSQRTAMFTIKAVRNAAWQSNGSRKDALSLALQ